MITPSGKIKKRGASQSLLAVEITMAVNWRYPILSTTLPFSSMIFFTPIMSVSCILTIRWIDHLGKWLVSQSTLMFSLLSQRRPSVRKEGDSNPRYGNPYGSLANCWFQPLTHPSKGGFKLQPWGYLLDCGCKGTTIFRTLQIFLWFFLSEPPIFFKLGVQNVRFIVTNQSDCP